MTTINRLATLGITLDVSEETLNDITRNDAFNISADEIIAMSKDERYALLKKCEEVLNRQDMDDWDEAYACYSEITAIMDREYREENMAEFKAYEAKMGQPDFDWDFYSDWHKDMFGYRLTIR